MHVKLWLEETVKSKKKKAAQKSKINTLTAIGKPTHFEVKIIT